ncbi:nucleoside triphosphate pyrophosphohydrolase family protein [Orenia marismortui]|uniref:hypothetical protein n=1 Tax=Orenia marismortui TaxID=46469 RepID=UPI00037FF096|nr:hypothetical protein [Orenia marismortui]
MEKNDLYQKAIDKWGIESQLLQVVEECSELNKAIIKHVNRDGDFLKNIIEEAADVEIMLEQLRVMTNDGIPIDKVKKKKLDRLEKLLRGD